MDFNNLLGHNLEKFGMVTVLDVTIYSMSGEPMLELDTLKVSSISSEGSQKEIRGGQGAELLLQYDYGRTAMVEITDALASMDSLEYLWGGNLIKGEVKYATKETITGVATVYTVTKPVDSQKNAFAINSTTSNKSGFVDISALGVVSAAANPPTGETAANLAAATDVIVVHYEAKTPSSANIEYALTHTNLTDTIYRLPENATLIDVRTATAGGGSLYTLHVYDSINKVITIDGAVATTTVYVRYTTSVGKQLTLSATDFPPIVKLVGSTFLISATTGEQITCQIEIPRFKLGANFSFTLEAEGDASVFDFSGVALSDNGDIIKIKTIN
jgi:hypothetical protein